MKKLYMVSIFDYKKDKKTVRIGQLPVLCIA